ncbi:DUF3127 domain-containing protein [Bacteroidia bacterium]|nr:DUF3127 domain-containing protein [Bacteroidia bacterium]
MAEINGKINVIVDKVSGQSKNGGEWQKQEFVIETDGQYPKKVCFSLWGDKINVLESLKPGDAVKVSFDPESREYNGRWYTDLRAWKIETGAQSSNTGFTPPPPASNDAPASGNANDAFTAASDNGDDDLPF